MSRKQEVPTSQSDGNTRAPPVEPVNGWYCWLVLVSSFTTLAVLDGINYSFGVMMGPLMAEMGGGRGDVSFAGSLLTGVYATSSIFSAKLIAKFGTRKVCSTGNVTAAVGLLLASFSNSLPTLYLTYSLIVGLGFGMMYIPAIVAVASHFKTRRALALGICVCGAGVGTFVMSPLEATLLQSFGWRGTMRVLSIVCLGCLALSSTMSPVEQETDEDESMEDNEDGCRSRTLKERIGHFVLGRQLYNHKNVTTYLIIAFADGIGTLGMFDPYTYLPDYAMSVGIDPSNSSFLISVIGISSSVGRIFSGWLNDQSWNNPILLTGTVLMLGSLPPIILTWFSGYAYILVFSCLYGLFTGIWISSLSPLLINVLSLSLLTPAFGLMTAIQGACALAGAPLAGAAVDHFKSTQVAMYFASGFLFLASLGFVFSFLNNRRLQKQANYNRLE